MDWTDIAVGIVAQAGAITQRRLIEEHRLPAPLWRAAVTDGRLRQVETHYGTVLTLGRAGQAAHPEAERLAGPSVAADRAYQLDALRVMEARGYRLHERRRQRLRNGRLAAHVTHATLHLPEAEARWRRERWGSDYGRSRPGGEQLGLCLLYATIRNGGPGSAHIRTLLARHDQSIQEMAHPMVVAVPDLNRHRSLLRESQAQMADPVRYPRGPRLRLIELPLPEIRRLS